MQPVFLINKQIKKRLPAHAGSLFFKERITGCVPVLSPPSGSFWEQSHCAVHES